MSARRCFVAAGIGLALLSAQPGGAAESLAVPAAGGGRAGESLGPSSAAPAAANAAATAWMNELITNANAGGPAPLDIGFDASGGIGHFIAAPGGALPTPLPGAPAAERARAFLLERRAAVGLPEAADLALERSESTGTRSWQRFAQQLGGLPVIGAEIIVQLDAANRVEGFHGRLAGTDALADVRADAQPAITRPIAERRALADQASRFHSAPGRVVTAELEIFVPRLLQEQGRSRVIWSVELGGDSPATHERILIDAFDGTVAWRVPLYYPALQRDIRDANSTNDAANATLVRSEGQGPCGITDADLTYDDLGATWTFYWNSFAWDSWDGAGDTMRGIVRYCGFGDAGTSCANAQFSGNTMYVGPGYAADDVIGHEVTHGVTNTTSQLIYAGQSGAIDESMSDIFGEFIDLTDGVGNDAPNVRWLLGEDMTLGALRDMKDPTVSPNPALQPNQPDRRNSPLYYNGTDDNGGVHTNSGVGNKLCFLLTDGQTFNGQTVYGMGIPAVAALFFETNAHLLVSSSGWVDLFLALRQAAVNLGWNAAEQNNVYYACVAVEIAAGENIWANATAACAQTGAPSCLGAEGPARTLGVAHGLAKPGDTIWMTTGTYHESLPLTIDKVVQILANGGPVTIGP